MTLSRDSGFSGGMIMTILIELIIIYLERDLSGGFRPLHLAERRVWLVRFTLYERRLSPPS